MFLTSFGRLQLLKDKLHSILRLEVSQLSKPRVSDFGTTTRATSTSTRNVTFVEANVMNISAKLFANLAFLLPWQPIKFSGLDKTHMVGRGLLEEYFGKPFVKLSAVR